MRGLGDGTISVRDVLRSPPEDVETCTIYDLLRATYNLGPTGVTQVLQAARVQPLTHVKYVSPMARLEIIRQLPKRAK